MPRAPRISGSALKAVARAARTPIGAATLYRFFRQDLQIDALAALGDEHRGEYPLDNRPLMARPPREGEGHAPLPTPTSWPRTSAALTRAYAEGKATPLEVTRRAFAHARSLHDRRPTHGPLLDYAEGDALRDAELSTARHRARAPRGPLDGVPVVIKEQVGVRGLPRRNGTRYLDGSPCAEDGTVVARLRAAGAIVLGTTPMTEFGMTPTGVNPLRDMPRNPHAPDRFAGGSSTGSGVAVATGVSPIAIGCDGGGSIRIPAATNGVFGIKPTWGRVSRFADIAAGSVAHVGPIAASTRDLAEVLEVIAGPDPGDPETLYQLPLPKLDLALGRGVGGLTIGLPEREWRDADGPLAAAGREALDVLEKRGARIVPVDAELLRFAPSIGYLAIGVEAVGLLRPDLRDHLDDMSLDLQVSMASLARVTVGEFTDAMRLRSGLRLAVKKLFEQIDLLALPTLAKPPAKVSDGDMKSGFLDSTAISAACRFSFLGNLTGLPAATCPVGLDRDRLPIGLQLVGDAWDEATVLAACAELERTEAARVQRPMVSVDLLD